MEGVIGSFLFVSKGLPEGGDSGTEYWRNTIVYQIEGLSV